MPYISVTCNTDITKTQQVSLKEQIGKAVESLGKSEKALMVHFMPHSALYFRGDDTPAAFINVQLRGCAEPSAYAEMTKQTTHILTDVLSIPSNRIFIKYEEVTHWGSNGEIL